MQLTKCALKTVMWLQIYYTLEETLCESPLRANVSQCCAADPHSTGRSVQKPKQGTLVCIDSCVSRTSCGDVTDLS